MEFAVSYDQRNWEKEYYKIGCRISRELSKQGLQALDDKLFANRMKKRGMSWTILGSQKMGKRIQLSYNGAWRHWCGRNKPKPLLEKGSQASRPWVKVIRDIVSLNPLYN